jgi:hypothetical protein
MTGPIYEIDKVAFETPHDRGFFARASYLKAPDNGDALIEIFFEGKKLREFFFPAYKIWNVAAHLSDIVDGELENSGRGYSMAASTGFDSPHIVLEPAFPDTSGAKP